MNNHQPQSSQSRKFANRVFSSHYNTTNQQSTLNPNAPVFSPSNSHRRSANISSNGRLIVNQINDQYQNSSNPPLNKHSKDRLFRKRKVSNLPSNKNISKQIPQNNLPSNQNIGHLSSNAKRSFIDTTYTRNDAKKSRHANIIDTVTLESEDGSSDDCILIDDEPYGNITNKNYTDSDQFTLSWSSTTVGEEELIFHNNIVVANKAADNSELYRKQESITRKKSNNETIDDRNIIQTPSCSNMISLNEESNSSNFVSNNAQINSSISISSSSYHDSTSRKLWKYYMDNKQTEAMYLQKVHLRNALHTVTSFVFENAGLFIVGSSMNGFGADNSDMDLSLTITCQDLNQKKEAFAVLSQLEKPLRNCPFIEKLLLIRATVPILKFRDRVSGVECDLNINNVDGIYNTYLLAMYNRVDWRLQPLGVYIKHWAQKLDLHDASKGRLSTYALILMLIQYLQAGCTPPVLPCLQTMFPQAFSYQKNIPEVDFRLELPWDELRSTNTQSLSELLMGFFEYYVEKFDFNRMAVSVRTGKPIPMEVAIGQLPTQQQLVNGKAAYAFVEEPFSLYNVSRSLYDDLVFPRIKRCLRHSLQVLRLNQSLNTIFVVPNLIGSESASHIDDAGPGMSGKDFSNMKKNQRREK